MKYVPIIFIITALTLVVGCQKAVDTAAEKSAINAILDSYILSVENEDIELYGKILKHDTNVVNFGSRANDRIVGLNALKTAIETQNTALSETKITESDATINISPDGQFAWATSLWNFKSTMAGQVMQLPVRYSWILEKRGKDWKIVHFHKSKGVAL